MPVQTEVQTLGLQHLFGTLKAGPITGPFLSAELFVAVVGRFSRVGFGYVAAELVRERIALLAINAAELISSFN